MKRLNRQKILTAFEETRNGFNQAHMRGAEHGDEVLMSCMAAHHFNANNMIEELGGESVQLPDLKPMKTPTYMEKYRIIERKKRKGYS